MQKELEHLYSKDTNERNCLQFTVRFAYSHRSLLRNSTETFYLHHVVLTTKAKDRLLRGSTREELSYTVCSKHSRSSHMATVLCVSEITV